ncbi:hypothetical protein LH612_32160, partial [Klebsiella pneumoniae]|nr:hypothetical protein [Klebsiella pneumoniae]
DENTGGRAQRHELNGVLAEDIAGAPAPVVLDAPVPVASGQHVVDPRTGDGLIDAEDRLADAGGVGVSRAAHQCGVSMRARSHRPGAHAHR